MKVIGSPPPSDQSDRAIAECFRDEGGEKKEMVLTTTPPIFYTPPPEKGAEIGRLADFKNLKIWI